MTALFTAPSVDEIIAKLGVPPFLLGLHWSTTERMSKQQADLLTSELERYRSLLTPVLRRILDTHLRLWGHTAPFAWSGRTSAAGYSGTGSGPL